MPSLPTLTVTAPQLAKCVEAFGDADGYKVVAERGAVG
jgi:hypothetical protein